MNPVFDSTFRKKLFLIYAEHSFTIKMIFQHVICIHGKFLSNAAQKSAQVSLITTKRRKTGWNEIKLFYFKSIRGKFCGKKTHEIVCTWNSLPFSSNWLVLSWNVVSKDHFWCQYHHGAFLQSIEAISLHQLLIHRMTQHNWKSQFVLPILWRLHCFWKEK